MDLSGKPRLSPAAIAFLLVALLGVVDAATGGARSSLAFGAVAAVAFAVALARPDWRRVVAWNLGLLWIGLLIFQVAMKDRPVARSKFREVFRRRALGEDVWPSVHAQDFMNLGAASPRHRPLPLPLVDGRPVFPLSAPAGMPSVYCREDDGWMTYENDILGFTNPPGAVDDVDVVVVGDSFVQGACVGTGYSIADRLRESGRNVYNLGMAGSGPLTYLGQLVEHLDRLKPQVVVWVHTAANDVSRPRGPFCDLDLEMAQEPLRRYLEDPRYRQDLVAHKATIDPQVRRMVAERTEELLRRTEKREQRRRPLSWLFLSPLFERVTPGDAPASPATPSPEPLSRQERMEAFAKVLDRALAVTRGAGAEMRFVYLPWTEAPADSPKEEVLKLVEDRGIPALDLAPLLDDRTELWAKNGGHLSRKGNAAVGEALDDFLSRDLGP